MLAASDSMRLERRVHVAKQILDHEAPGTRAGVDRGEDEQRLEQDREVVPERHPSPCRRTPVQNLRDADRQRRRAARAMQDGVLADFLRGLADQPRA